EFHENPKPELPNRNSKGYCAVGQRELSRGRENKFARFSDDLDIPDERTKLGRFQIAIRSLLIRDRSCERVASTQEAFEVRAQRDADCICAPLLSQPSFPTLIILNNL